MISLIFRTPFLLWSLVGTDSADAYDLHAPNPEDIGHLHAKACIADN